MAFLDKYKYSIAGAILALLLGLIVVSVGFFKTLFLFLLVGVGGVVGNRLKDTGILEELIKKCQSKK